MARYELYLTTDTGVRVLSLDAFKWFESSRVANDVGTLALSLQANFDVDEIKPDRMIQVWRAPIGGTMSLWRSYFVRRWIYATSGSKQSIVVYGYDPNILLKWRVVGYDAGETETNITDYADDMLKAMVTENMLGSAASARDWSAYISAETDLSAAPSITKEIQWRNVLEMCREICDASKEAGTLLWFDMAERGVTSGAISFIFRTFTNQPGRDRSSVKDVRVVFDQERGNMGNPEYEEDFTEEVTYVYAGGQGELDGRRMLEAENTARSGISVWGRKEAFVSATAQTSSDGTEQAAYSVLREGMPKRKFTSAVIDIDGSRFGRDWSFGDKVVARYRGNEFDSIITMVNIRVENGRETISARLEYEY